MKNSIFLLTILIICCTDRQDDMLERDKFIDLYAKITIISEIKIDKEQKQKLIADLLKENNTNIMQYRHTMHFYKERPDEWVTILKFAREHIKKLKSEKPPF